MSGRALSQAQFPRVFQRQDRVRTDSDDSLRRSNLFEVWNGPGQPHREGWGDRLEADTTVLAGQPMQHSELPDTIFHVTTDKPAVEKSGVIRASAGGEKAGLGGSHKEVISTTVDPHVAQGLEDDMRNYAMYAASGDVEGVMTHLYEEHEKRGILDKFDNLQRQYGTYASRRDQNDSPDPGGTIDNMFSLYYSARRQKTGERNPVILGGVGKEDSPWYHVDPDKVGTIKIPRESIPSGTLVSSFDIGQTHGLEEARVHGDIPLRDRK